MAVKSQVPSNLITSVYNRGLFQCEGTVRNDPRNSDEVSYFG